MIYFTLENLLIFLEECKLENYTPIDDIIDALYDYNMSEAERMKIARAIIRFHGLREIIFERDKKKGIVWEYFVFRNTINPTQLFDINFQNGKVDFWQNLN